MGRLRTGRGVGAKAEQGLAASRAAIHWLAATSRSPLSSAVGCGPIFLGGARFRLGGGLAGGVASGADWGALPTGFFRQVLTIVRDNEASVNEELI